MPEALFNRLAIIASAKIKANTFGRIDESNIPNEVKLCTCNIADTLKELEKSDGKTNESVGSWSIAYDTEANKVRINNIMKDYLTDLVDSEDTPLLYRGC
jgi:hypothetical protein